MNSSVAIRCDLFEQIGHGVDIAELASLARVDDGSNGVCAGGRVVDGDLFVADGIVVWIRGVVHHRDCESDDGVATLDRTTARG